MANESTFKRARKAAGLSQFELAVKAGTTPQTIARVERGYDPSWSIGLRLAEQLGYDVAALRKLFEVRS